MATWYAKNSGYLASATAVAFTGAQVQTLTNSGSGGAALADNEFTDLSDEIDNSTTKYLFADIYIDLASAAFTGTDSGIEVYLVPTVDGTTYPTWTGNGTSDEQENALFLVGFGFTTGTTAVQDIVIRGIELPPGKFKFGFRNRGGVSLATTGNTAYWRPYRMIAEDS